MHAQNARTQQLGCRCDATRLRNESLVDDERGEGGEGGLRVNDGRLRGTAEAARRVESVNTEKLVDEAARDAHHGRAAVLALDVE
eukprot:CAMPEP_0115846226 /NCGR_PEP_ID=MMETSP0287-20121206/9753_1 /TAXON_ID=412157 /ORGANISM="Chrysochromulina rotalis, Strain UIO044" /LENGTH=84 /DNA_ID=CAMNT_0003300013 /DNA_START=477 /DNA_END=728 /DNA_ORIENTATION=+